MSLIQRFFGEFDLSSKRIKISEQGLINQIRNVLRLKAGDKITLCDGNLKEARSEIKEIKKDFIEVEVLETSVNGSESEREVVLYLSILKKENFEWAVQKAVEAGVAEIVPVITERTVKLNVKEDRINKIITEAAEQSGRGILPALLPAIKFEEAVKQSSVKNELNILFNISGAKFAPTPQNKPKRTGIFVGPEGGFADHEIEFAKNNGFKIQSLGNLTLRAETAAVIASYLACN
jgi:16S rRNA (uracil1498-N3)-methyltransferase